MRLPILACASKRSWVCVGLLAAAASMGAAQKIKVPTAPPTKAKTSRFRDSRNGVRFNVPAGWRLMTKDHEVSTFRLDARSATEKSEMRAVASLDFNPFPESTLSSALFYYSVQRHTNDAECAAQAEVAAPKSRALKRQEAEQVQDVQNIGGMNFVHGHDEHGGICVEARDEVYTAYRKGSCYRFDLALNTFCSISSGARELSFDQIHDLEQRMTTILSSVELDWEKSGPRMVPVPEVPVEQKRDGRPLVSAGEM